MKKALLTIMSVAILGALGSYISGSKDASAKLVSSVSSNSGSASQSINIPIDDSTSTPAAVSTPTTYKDGTYNGLAAQTSYGNVQVAIVIGGGKMTDVKLLQMPNDRAYSREVTAVAGPLLRQSTLQHQNTNIDFVSGATSTSYGFEQSLQAALDKALA